MFSGGFIDKKCTGFTLLELLLVMALISIMGIVTIPKIGHIMDENMTIQASRDLVGAIRLVQQSAILNNETQEVLWMKNLNSTARSTNFGGLLFKPFSGPTTEISVAPFIVPTGLKGEDISNNILGRIDIDPLGGGTQEIWINGRGPSFRIRLWESGAVENERM